MRILVAHGRYGYQFFNTQLRGSGAPFPTTIEELISVPVLFEPETGWEYCVSHPFSLTVYGPQAINFPADSASPPLGRVPLHHSTTSPRSSRTR